MDKDTHLMEMINPVFHIDEPNYVLDRTQIYKLRPPEYPKIANATLCTDDSVRYSGGLFLRVNRYRDTYGYRSSSGLILKLVVVTTNSSICRSGRLSNSLTAPG